MKLNRLRISGDSVYLDDMEIKGVIGYELKSSTDKELAKLTLEMYVRIDDIGKTDLEIACQKLSDGMKKLIN